MTAGQLNEKLKSGGATFFGAIVLVARERAAEKKGSIYIPQQHQSKQQYAAVVAFGDESIFAPGGKKDGKLKIGDALYLPAYGGVVVKQKMGDEIYVLEALYDTDVLLSYGGSQDVELESDGSQTSA